MPKKNLPLSVFRSFLKEQGALRIADDAVEALRNHTEEKARDILLRAKRYATHARRKTIMDADIRLALRDLGI